MVGWNLNAIESVDRLLVRIATAVRNPQAAARHA